MKHDRYFLTMNQKIFDEIAEGVCALWNSFSCYLRVRTSVQCIEMTTILFWLGTYMFKVVPFRLMNAPSTFQRVMGFSLAELPFVKIYHDDIVVFTDCLDDRFSLIKHVLILVTIHGLKLEIQICQFAKSAVPSEGHIVSPRGEKVYFKKVSVIKRTARTRNQIKLWKVLCIAVYYFLCIESFAFSSFSLHTTMSAKKWILFGARGGRMLSLRKREIWQSPMYHCFHNFKSHLS